MTRLNNVSALRNETMMTVLAQPGTMLPLKNVRSSTNAPNPIASRNANPHNAPTR